MGHFFNVLIPGATGGDVMKAIYVAHACKGQRTEAVSTIVLERVIGLLSLIGLIAVITLVRLPFFLSSPSLKRVALFNAALLVAGVAFLSVAAARDGLTRWSWGRRLTSGPRLGAMIGKAHEALTTCLRHPRVLGLCVLFSLTNHVIQTVCPWMLGRALGIDLPFIDYLTLFPVIALIASVPFTPGGLGVREVAVVELLAMVGVEREMALTLSLMLYGAIVIWSLIGGVLYLVLRHHLSNEETRTP